jgi:FkbM family methyltransferase
LKSLLKAVLAQTPYRLVRDRGANRFEAFDAALAGLKERGFLPGIIIDGGAHLGWFSLKAKKIFPGASFHLIDPQPACAGGLKAVCDREGFAFHQCALAAANGTLRLTHHDLPSTGAFICDGEGATDVEAKTLDTLFDLTMTRADRALLKLDLQSYEIPALQGAVNVLDRIEVILTEAIVFAIGDEPCIAELIVFLHAHDFQLYDIAGLGGRTRDNRLHSADLVFVSKDSELMLDHSWE